MLTIAHVSAEQQDPRIGAIESLAGGSDHQRQTHQVGRAIHEKGAEGPAREVAVQASLGFAGEENP